MIVIFHGTDNISSRTAFADLKTSDSLSFDAENINIIDLQQALSDHELFKSSKNFFIENLFSKKSSKNLESVVNLINANSKTYDFYLWSNDEVSKRDINKLKGATENNFSIPKNLFAFLDSIQPGNASSVRLFHKTLEESDENIIFFMILRQFRLLIATAFNIGSVDEVKRLAPWQKSKYQKQAGKFSKDRLLYAYKKLFEIDLAQKTGQTDTSLSKNIDFFLLGL